MNERGRITRRGLCAGGALCLALLAQSALAEEAEQAEAGAGEKAFSWGVVYKGTLMGVASGGADKVTTYHGNLDLTLSVDGEQALGWPGSTFFVHVLNDHGGKLNETVDSIQGVDNIEVADNATRLYQLWVEQRLADDRFSALVGLYDINSEFYVTDAAGVFLNPSFGIGTEIAQTGENGPSIFPVASLGLRLKVSPTANTYLQLALLDGVPGDPDHPKRTAVKLESGDGLLWIVEGGTSVDITGLGGGKLAVGAWGYTEEVDDVLRTDGAGDPRQVRNQGAYVLFDQPLYRAGSDGARGLDAFLRVGLADDDANAVDIGWQAGVAYTGLFAARSEDVLALGVTYAGLGDPYRDAVRAAGDPDPRDEWIVEATYRVQINEHFALQPDVQYVRHWDRSVGHVTVIGLRGELAF